MGQTRQVLQTQLLTPANHGQGLGEADHIHPGQCERVKAKLK